jgi:myo-inositol 2-dehydrogenase / D-chiro-inositol 1-dehydrogenase
MEKVKFVVFGLGRMGQIHAQNILLHPKAQLVGIVDQSSELAEEIAERLQCDAWDPDSVWSECEFDAILIASPTMTHMALIEKAIEFKKAIFCEKPIDLSAACAKKIVKAVQDLPFMTGFNRRFDSQFQQLSTQIRQGDIGRLHTLQIISRDPALPSLSYLANSGGLFKDMMIHDFDMACWLLGELPTRVCTMASWMQAVQPVGFKDVDTAVVIMQTASGKLCQISNNRQTGYGYDQRIEAFGESGQIRVNNVPTDQLIKLNATGEHAAVPLNFFLERYEKSYQLELDAFVTGLLDQKPFMVDVKAGWRALVLAECAQQSLETGEVVSCEGLF